jgi:hypothetical protein
VRGLLLCVSSAVVGCMGILGARSRSEHGPSCPILLFYFSSLVMSLILVWLVIFLLAVARDNWNAYLTQNWDALGPLLPASLKTGSTRADQIASATAVLVNGMDAIAAISAIVCAIVFVAILAAARIIHHRTLASTSLTVLLHVYGWLGLVFLVVGFYIEVGVLLRIFP